MKKKILLVMIFTLLCAAIAFGCGKKNNSSSDGGDSSSDASDEINIVDSALTLDCFETYSLEVEFRGSDTLGWSSSDSSIVSVDENGLLTAGIKLGIATITVRAGDATDTCEVTVLLKSGLPEMKAVNSVSVSEGGKYEVPFYVYYNAKDVTEYLTFGCNADEENAESIATASVGGNVATFSGVSEGETSYTVYTTIFDRLYAEKVRVSVRNTDVVYVVNDLVGNQIQVRNDNERFTSDVEIYYKNEKVPDSALNWSVSDENVITIGENGRLVGGMEGVAALFTEYRGKTVSIEVIVVKDREYVTVSQESAEDFNLDVSIMVDTSAKKRTYSVNETKNNSLKVGGNADKGVVVRAYVNGEALNVEGFAFADGVVTIPTKVLGADLYGEKTLTIEVEDETVVRIYTLNVLLITKIPTSLTDFKNAIVAQWRGDRILGYFVLDRDIDFNLYEISVYATDWNWDNGFRGTLDGRGNALKNMRSTMYGISAQMGDGATIKNLKIPNLRYDGGETTLFARGAAGVTFENIEITLTADSSCASSSNEKSCGVLISHDMRRCVYKNITINAQGKNLQRIFGGTSQEKGSSSYENIIIYASSVGYYENDIAEIPEGVTLITND